MGTLIFLAFMWLLFRYSDNDRWWLWFAVVVGLLAQMGYKSSGVELLFQIIVFKVIKEFYNRRPRG